MGLKVHLEFEVNGGDEYDAMAVLSKIIGQATNMPVAAAAQEATAPAVRGKRAKKAKSAAGGETASKPVVPAERAAPEAGPAPAAQEPAAPEAYTLDQVRQKLLQVFNSDEAAGAKIATKILKDFGCVRVSEVPPHKFAEFIQACEAKLS